MADNSQNLSHVCMILMALPRTGDTTEDVLKNCEQNGIGGGSARVSNAMSYASIDTRCRQWSKDILPSRTARDASKLASELQNACSALYIWYLSPDRQDNVPCSGKDSFTEGSLKRQLLDSLPEGTFP